ncbi:MAG: 2-amino-4-hydroxy-6-hydroxymethyldihydropteridine diphosphokinase [Alphaproteobacteria bacterium]
MIFIGLGANLDSKYGSPEQALRECVNLLAEHDVEVVAFSNIWKSAPVPVSDQPWYCNAVCGVETSLSPQELLVTLNMIEEKAGRIRSKRNAPRVLDLDIISYHTQTILVEGLKIPHERMHERAFVLLPLQEVSPNWVHPTLGKDLITLLSEMPGGQQIQCVKGSAPKLNIVGAKKYA